MEIRITNRNRSHPIPIQSLKRIAEKILLKLEQPDTELGIVLVGDRGIRRLNRDYRGKDAPTDVLSFSVDMEGSFRGSGSPPRLLGDVVISIETADRQARERGHDLDREIAELLIHGTLHLLGFDHEKPNETRRMTTIEQRLRKTCLDG